MSIASSNDPVLQLIREGVRRGVFPGVAVCASRNGGVRYDHAIGLAALEPWGIPMVTSALFDVASLTKIIATTTAMMILVDSGQLELEQSVADFLPIFERHGKQNITLLDLLCHSSGLPAHRKFFEELTAIRESGEELPYGEESIDWVIQKIAEIEAKPPCSESVYSDLGFIVLGRVIEVVSKQSLDEFCTEHIFLPLGMEDTFFLPLFDQELRKERLKGRQVVSTEKCPWRKGFLVGEVHDGNCHSFGGVAGHAGLFSTTGDLHRFAIAMIRCSTGESSFVTAPLINEFWRRQERVKGSSRAIGWDTPSESGSQAGDLFSVSSVGHLGFTGCSLWIEREQALVVVLLSNRVHPTRENMLISEFRPILHNTIYGLCTESSRLPPPGKGRPEDFDEKAGVRVLSEDERRSQPALRPPPASLKTQSGGSRNFRQLSDLAKEASKDS